MKTENLITVILITYNHEKWIAKAIESVLEQETNFPFIIKIFDDCSNDKSLEIVKNYIAKYPNLIKLFANTKNIGVARNFKKAFTNIDTKYFCFLETDDYWCDKTKLQQQFDILEKHPDCSMCGHNTRIYDLITANESYICNNGTFSNGYDLQNKENHIFSFEDSPYIHTSSRMYRNGLVNFSKEPNWLCVDIYHFYKFLSKGKIYYINKVMSVYNITYMGDYTKYNKLQKEFQYFNVLFRLKKYFNPKYNQYFASKILQLYRSQNHNFFNNEHPLFFIYIYINLKYWYALLKKRFF
jgi:glycosyltransferase involved in cell wall biosynthesis